MEIALIQVLGSLLNTLITASGMIWAAVINAHGTKGNSPDGPQMKIRAMAENPASAQQPPQSQTARRRRFGLSLLLIVWGQLNIVAGQWLDAGGGLSAWSFSFIGQGLVMLLLGFWLLLRD